MEIIHFPDAYTKTGIKSVVIGIGKFDGFHIGHQKLIQAIINISEEKNIIPSVFTFKNFPCDFYIYTWEEKMNFFKKAGIKLCLWSDFEKIKAWEPDKFLEFLKNFYKVSHIVVGKNFRFGSHRKGDEKFLLSWGKKNNLSVVIIPSVIINKHPVSSSNIRALIKQGSIHTIHEMTGRYFSVSGKVVKGIGLGRKLKVPTANIRLMNKIPLQTGVYIASIEYKNVLLKGIAYYGSSPTVAINKERFETHIFDFSKNIYGEMLRVYLIKKIRAEEIFSSKEALKKQIEKDIYIAKNYNIPYIVGNLTMPKI